MIKIQKNIIQAIESEKKQIYHQWRVKKKVPLGGVTSCKSCGAHRCRSTRCWYLVNGSNCNRWREKKLSCRACDGDHQHFTFRLHATWKDLCWDCATACTPSVRSIRSQLLQISGESKPSHHFGSSSQSRYSFFFELSVEAFGGLWF